MSIFPLYSALLDRGRTKNSESEEEDELPVGDRVNRYGRRVGNWRLCISC